VPKNKRKLNPLGVFLAIVAGLVAIAMAIDWSTRSRLEVTEQPGVPLTLEQMSREQLLTAFNEIRFDGFDARPSVLEGVDRRVQIARLVYAKTTAATARKDIERLLGALGTAYTIRRANQLDFSANRDELRTVLALVNEEFDQEQRQLARGMEFELLSHQLADGGDPAQIVPEMTKFARRFRDEFSGREAAELLANPLFSLTLSELPGDAASEVLAAVSSVYADHPDEQLRLWSGKLADDAVMRRKGLFPLYESMRRGDYLAPSQFVERIGDFLAPELTDAGVARIIMAVSEINELQNGPDSRLGFQRIREIIVARPDTEDNRRNIAECDRGLERLDALHKPVSFEVTDLRGRTLRLDDPQFSEHAFIVTVISSGTDFDSFCNDQITIEGIESLESRNIHLVALCLGLDAAEAQKELGSWASTNVYIVPDPDRNSTLLAACPTSHTPFAWLVSRRHTLADFNLSQAEVVHAVEGLMYSRDGG
jgi:hypothetical protein